MRRERTEFKAVTERIADEVVIAEVDGVETVLHTEFQAQHEAGLPARLAVYHALLVRRFAPRPVRTLVVYLMPEAPAGPAGPLPRSLVAGQLRFDYEVFCPLERPLDPSVVARYPLLAPLAALTPGIGPGDLPALRAAVLGAPLSRDRRLDCLFFVHVLAARRFPLELLGCVVRSDEMEDSPSYQRIIAQGLTQGRVEGRVEGRAEGRRLGEVAVVVRWLRRRLGAVDDDVIALLSSLDDARFAAVSDELLAYVEPAAIAGCIARLRIADEVVIAEVDGVETVLHTEFQAQHEAGLPARLARFAAVSDELLAHVEPAAIAGCIARLRR